MNLNLEDMQITFPNHLWLPITTETLPGLVESAYSNPASYRNAYMNLICLQAFLNWVKDNPDIHDTPNPWPSIEALPSLWEFINGTMISFGNRRIVLIPSDALDTEELSVPQEWVDIPLWGVDYYIGVQVNEEKNWLQFWGYTSHRLLKTKGVYDPIYRHYDLDRDFVLTDIDLLWVALSLDLQETKPLVSLPEINPEVVQSNIEQLSKPLPYSPRLELAFSQWSAIMAQDEWRQHLYHHRLRSSDTPSAPRINAELNRVREVTKQAVINAALWLQDQLDQVAQDLQWQLLPTLAPEPIALRESSQELELILANLTRNGFKIPQIARSIEDDLQVSGQLMKLYIVVWPVVTSQSIPEWYLLVIVSGTADHPLLPGTHLAISDDQDILVDLSLQVDSPNQYLCGSVSGNWEETFQVRITRPDGASITLPQLIFQPEPAL